MDDKAMVDCILEYQLIDQEVMFIWILTLAPTLVLSLALIWSLL